MSSYNVRSDAPVDNRFQAFFENLKPWATYSQHGEEYVVQGILDRIGVSHRFCVEAGAADGLFMSNCRFLIDQGWRAILVEPDVEDFQKLQSQFKANAGVQLFQGFLASQPQSEHEVKLDDLLDRLGAPTDFDILSLDVDSSEYYLLLSMMRFRPRVIIVEYDPLAPEMFIPELRGPGQAGHLALRYVAEARGYDVIGRTQTNLICVRKDLSPLLIAEAPLLPDLPEDRAEEMRKVLTPDQPAAKYQVWANNRWQNLDGAVEVASEEEAEAIKAGKAKFRPLTSTTRRVNIALAMSTPRIGYLDAMEQIIDLAYAAGISRFRGQGVFWSHSLSRSINAALDWYDEKTDEGFDYILTADYDSFAMVENIKALAELLSRHPEVDCLVPLQVKRGQFLEVLAGWSGGRNLTLDLVPIDQGHFGFTLFRREFFEQLSLPWFREKADENGHWGEGRTDADIGFWRNAKECGLNVALAPKIIVGHGDECVVWPRIVNGKVEKVYQHVNEWNGSKIAPEGIGVISEFRPLRRDSLCPDGAAFVSTMPAPSGFCEDVGCERV